MRELTAVPRSGCTGCSHGRTVCPPPENRPAGAARHRARAPAAGAALARVVGNSCNLELIIDDIRAELAGRPYELVAVAGGWQHRTRRAFAEVIRAAAVTDSGPGTKPLSPTEALVLTAIAYFQPITRGELSRFLGKEVSRDLIGVLRAQDFIGSGPRAPQPGAPYTYVTTRTFLSQFGLATLRDLPNFAALEDAGLLSKDKLLASDIPVGLMRKSIRRSSWSKTRHLERIAAAFHSRPAGIDDQDDGSGNR